MIKALYGGLGPWSRVNKARNGSNTQILSGPECRRFGQPLNHERTGHLCSRRIEGLFCPHPEDSIRPPLTASRLGGFDCFDTQYAVTSLFLTPSDAEACRLWLAHASGGL